MKTVFLKTSSVSLLCALFFCSFIPVFTQPVLFPTPLSPRIANYTIDTRLDVHNNTLTGKETLKWFNKSTDVIHDLQFHLYLNAFRNSRSTYMQESKRRTRPLEPDKENWGFIDVKKITTITGEDITSTMKFIQPDDGNTDDKTVFELPLTTPLSPGDSISLTIAFEEKLPSPPVARSGAEKEFFFVAQWFPKVGVYIDGAWNCHQYHANSEFFADFGMYNVRMTVPEKNIVGATGVEYDIQQNGDGTTTHFYHAEDVHDFVWTTSPEFVETKGKEQDVNIRILLQPDHQGQAMRHLDAAKLSVRYFQNWYGDYPFPNLTVVDSRRGATAANGMEYPTLITAGTAYGLPDEVRMVELVIIHEFGHNYWYHMLASNEFEESWLDEGINTYTEIQIMHDAYGPGDIINCMGWKMDDVQLQRSQYLLQPSADPTVRKAWEYSPGSYGVNSYSKPGLILTTLQNYIGRKRMQKIMQTYYTRWRFKHPKSQDFVNVVNDVTGENFNWFFDQALYTNKKIDYSVDRVFSNEQHTEDGYDYSLSSDSMGQKGKQSGADTSSGKLYESELLVRRLGDFVFPVEVEVAFENGEKIREKWDGADLWKKFRYVKPVRIEYATVDPDGKIPLDINYTNNSKTVETQSAGINKSVFSFMFYLQSLLDQPDLLNMLTFLPSLF